MGNCYLLKDQFPKVTTRMRRLAQIARVKAQSYNIHIEVHPGFDLKTRVFLFPPSSILMHRIEIIKSQKNKGFEGFFSVF